MYELFFRLEQLPSMMHFLRNLAGVQKVRGVRMQPDQVWETFFSQPKTKRKRNGDVLIPGGGFNYFLFSFPI